MRNCKSRSLTKSLLGTLFGKKRRKKKKQLVLDSFNQNKRKLKTRSSTPNSRFKIPYFSRTLHSKMANKLKVEELRNELAQRGLTTTGTKPVLVLKTTLSLSPLISFSFSAGY